MAREWVPDVLWHEIESLLPARRPRPKGGRPPIPDRNCLVGIIFVLRTGSPWNAIPAELGAGSGSTCWRRFKRWSKAGVWSRVWHKVLNHLGRRGKVDLSHAVIDSASVRAVFGGRHTGPNPTDRAKRGCKRHLITDSNGTPLTVKTTPANVPDGVPAIGLLDSIPPIQGPRGRPRFRPLFFVGDRAYGWKENRAATRARGIEALLACPQDDIHGSGLGTIRWVVEAALSWFSNHRRLRFCYERTGAHFLAFHQLAAALICFKKLGDCNLAKCGF